MPDLTPDQQRDIAQRCAQNARATDPRGTTMTTAERLNADLYRAAFARLGPWPARGWEGQPMSDAERAARHAEMDRLRARYADESSR